MAKEPAIKPMPFPGESPTVALAMAAGQKYGLHEEKEKPARARPKRKAGATKKKASARKPAARATRRTTKSRAR
jgi:hypothetical protein